MDAVTTIALPIFALVFSGYGARRLRLLAPATIEGLNGFVYWFALPALLFVKVAETPILEVFDWRLLAAYHAGGLSVFALAMLAGRLFWGERLAVLGVQGLAAAFGNVGYMGLPLLFAAFGREATLPAVLVVVSDILVTVSRAGRARSGLAVLRTIVAGIVRNPLLLATAAGALLSIAGPVLPAPLRAFAELLGAAALPCALFALGASLVGGVVSRGLDEVALLVGLKLVIHPLAVFLAATRVFALDPLATRVVMLEASLPAAATVFVLAQRYGVYVDRASSAVFLSTLMSVVTVTGLLVLLTR
jgi:predicted permease